MTIALVHFNHAASGSLTTWPDMRTSPWKPNYGDMLVCAAIIRQLKLDRTVRVGFGGLLKEKVDRALIRGSTYLHKRFDFEAANRTLDSIDAPVTIVGLGAQNPVLDVTFLDDHAPARDFISRLNEKAVSISVRGQFTADVAERLGARSVRITGCPSLFYTLSAPSVRVPEMLSMPERSLGVSLHTGLTQNIFCHAPKEARRMHGEVMSWAIQNAANVSFFEQGVMLEYDIADHDLPFAERLAAARTVCERIEARELTPERLMAHMVSVKSIEEWLAKARDLDAIVGFRFHGNMVALLQGKPCYYYVYDSRLSEFCRIYSLPHQDVASEWRDPAAAMLEHDWSSANNSISMCFNEITAFYRENGLATALI